MNNPTKTPGRDKSIANRTIEIADLSICYYCKTTGLTEKDKFCPNCGFPQRGSQVEMKRFVWNINNKKLLLADHKKAVDKARNILFVLAGIFPLFGLIIGALSDMDLFVIVSNFIVGGIYLGLGFWAKKNPFPAILTGFCLYITIMVISAVVDPTSIVKGIIMKVIIIGGFYYGYKGVKEAEALEEELAVVEKARDLKASDELSEVQS
jgi:hypothetical protein